jgi:hypothetical protein
MLCGDAMLASSLAKHRPCVRGACIVNYAKY